ncbi:MAG: RDD family protein [Actinomycetes bacterium]
MSGSPADLSDPFKRVGISVAELILFSVTLGIGWLVWSVVAARNSQTPTMSRVGVRVINLGTHQPASLGTMAIRELGIRSLLTIPALFITFAVSDELFSWWTVFLVFAFWYLGGVSIFFTKSRQALWDILANTTVVDTTDGPGVRETQSARAGTSDGPRTGRAVDRAAW